MQAYPLPNGKRTVSDVSKKQKKQQSIPPLFIQTKLYQDTIKQTAPASHYRHELRYLIGKKITLRGRFKKSSNKYIPFQKGLVSLLLVEHLTVQKVPDWFSKKKFSPIDHIWIFAPKGYMETQRLYTDTMIDFTGYVYEYVHNGKRNISLSLMYAEPSYKKEKYNKVS